MTYDQLFKSVKAGDIRPAYLFYGPEVCVMNSALDALRQKLLPEGLEELNQNLFEGAADVQAVIDAAETLPLMGEKRLVLLRDWTALTGRGTPQPRFATGSPEHVRAAGQSGSR